MKKLILIGAGMRGIRYTDIAAQMGDDFKVVAVAEPIDDRRNYIKKRHGIPDDMCFTSWEPLLALGRIADAALICTMDRAHTAPALAAIENGYDILLEKPMAPTPEDCVKIADAADKKGVKLLVCFVLRYAPFFKAVKRVIDEGKIGEVMSIHHIECVGNVHQSHSFVRGNWHNSGESSFMLLQKSSHDMDILQWLAGKPVKRVSSFGALTYFKKENAPANAPERCIDGCPAADTCPYNAVKLYTQPDEIYKDWFPQSSTKKVDPTKEDIIEMLHNSDYGKCVYKCNNDVVDHQVVNLEFENSATASFNMSAFCLGDRSIRVMGTKGEVYGDMGENTITLYTFADKKTEIINYSDVVLEQSIAGGHGGGDEGIMQAFDNMLVSGDDAVCDRENTLDNHLVAFAAEESRLTGKIVDMKEFKQRFKNK